MYCSQCGSKIEEGNTYCMTCGTPVKIRPKTGSEENPFGNNASVHENAEKPQKNAEDEFYWKSEYGWQTDGKTYRQDPEPQAEQESSAQLPAGMSGPDGVEEERSFAQYLLLTFVTCGIYGIIFKYKLTEDVNRICEGDGQHTMNYLAALLLTIVTCGIYGYVWMYQIGDRIQQTAGKKYGITSNISGVKLLALTLAGTVTCGVCGYIADYELINGVNELAAAYNRSGR